MEYRGCGPGCLGFLTILIFFVMFLMVFSLFMALLYAIGLVLAMIYRYLFSPQPRMFNALPISRWSSAYEQASFFLHNQFEVDVTTTPLRVLIGCILISIVPTFGLQALLLSVGLQTGWVVSALGVVTGFLTALNMTQPPAGLFPLKVPTRGLEGVLPEADYYLLPED